MHFLTFLAFLATIVEGGEVRGVQFVEKRHLPFHTTALVSPYMLKVRA